MSGEEKFWVSLWALVAIVLVAVIGSISGVMAYKSSVLERMVSEQHVEPMRASCALDIGERKDSVCAILAAH